MKIHNTEGARLEKSYSVVGSERKLQTRYKHDYLFLPPDVAEAIFTIYTHLSDKKLLERCVGGFRQNNNESCNQLIWKITPKILPCGSKIVGIAAYIAAGIFNEGTT